MIKNRQRSRQSRNISVFATSTSSRVHGKYEAMNTAVLADILDLEEFIIPITEEIEALDEHLW